MNPKRLSIALLGALLVSGFCTLLLGQRLSHRSSKKEAVLRYVAAVEPIEAGTVVQPEQVTFKDVPASQAINGAFQKSADVVGRSAMYPIEKGQIVLNKYLAPPGTGAGLTSKIAEGMRAVALKSDDVVGVAGFLLPGSHVDILVTYRAAGRPDPVTTTVVQDAQVIAVNHQSQPDPQGKPVPINVVTVLANPADTEKLVLAGTQGSIYFVMRNGGDHQQSPGSAVELSQLNQQAAAKAIKVRQTPIKKSAAYQVEQIIGDKSSVLSFN